ncbi:ATP-binding cassette domain-containing protein [Mesorhizobium sp. M0848]|uniref:ATP-binding cassette domain-containing protein n=1 Tax=Mesorhizobium sp. M0848 TaxID=2957012 RepID=UPI0033397C3D
MRSNKESCKTDVNISHASSSNPRIRPTYLTNLAEQLSGGERQRIAIARALLVNPKLLICAEILSALDVCVQSRIVELFQSLKKQHSVAMLFISHDLAVVQACRQGGCALPRLTHARWQILPHCSNLLCTLHPDSA